MPKRKYALTAMLDKCLLKPRNCFSVISSTSPCRLSDKAIKDRDSDQRRSISRSNRQEPRTNNLTIRRLSQLFTLPTATEKKLLSFQIGRASCRERV